MRSTGFKNHRLGLALAAALGAIAMLALPSAAAAKARDRNHDHIPDRWEKRHHLSLRVNQAHLNQDHEGLNNRQEFLAGTDPRDPDTDNNGITDGEENAGKIVSFSGEELEIELFGGGTVSGKVTDQTEIECHQGGSATASDTQDGAESSEDGSEQQESSENDGEQQEESSDDDSGEQQSGDDDAAEQEPDAGGCTTSALVAGTIVREAELSLEDGGATFEKVELAG